MQLVSTFADVYFKDIFGTTRVDLLFVTYAWYIKENEIKQAHQKKKRKKEEKDRTNTDTVCKESIT